MYTDTEREGMLIAIKGSFHPPPTNKKNTVSVYQELRQDFRFFGRAF